MALLKKGSKGPAVKELQKLLNEKLAANLVVDGIFGSGTEDIIEDYQRKKGLIVDGIVGPKTLNALKRMITIVRETANESSPSAVGDLGKGPTWDSSTDKRIKLLHPSIQAKAYQLVNGLEKEHGIKIRIYSSFRSYKEQNQIFAKGRTTDYLKSKGIQGIPGKPSDKKVTNAMGGTSYHNFGLALDMVELKDGKALWSNRNWTKIGKYGESIGWEWGGFWQSFVDKPHFQWTYGLSTSKLRSLNDGSATNGSGVNIGNAG